VCSKNAGGEDRFTGAAINGRAKPTPRRLPGQLLASGVGEDR
jgi:hypothetical protein